MLKFNVRLAVIVAAAGLALAACSKGGAGTAAGDMTMGKPDAPVKVVEYASASCIHCAAFNNEVMPAFKAKYIDTGKVHYTLKEFITAPPQLAAAGFLLARCAANGGKDSAKYFTVLDAIFHNLESIVTSGDFRGGLLAIAQSTGMSEKAFDACVGDEKQLQALNTRVEKAAREEKIDSTPTFFVNGKKIAEGEVSMAQLDAAIAAASAK